MMLSKLLALAAGLGGSPVPADWNQNDPNAADYVKNRTHYDAAYKVSNKQLDTFVGPEFRQVNGGVTIGTGEYMVKASDLTPALSIMQETGYVKYRSEYKLGETAARIVNVTDKGYTLVVGSRTVFYTRVAVVLQAGYSVCQIYDDTGAPRNQSFVTLDAPGIYLWTSGSTSSNVDLYVRWNELVPIDEKYIPSTIARKSDLENAGGSGVCIVNVACDADLSTETFSNITADKTYNEVKAAYDAGAYIGVRLLYRSGELSGMQQEFFLTVHMLDNEGERGFMFMSNAGMGMANLVSIVSDGSVIVAVD